MDNLTKTATVEGGLSFYSDEKASPGLFIAHCPEFSCTVDRCLVTKSFVIGRDAGADLSFRDGRMSKRHFKISFNNNKYNIEDMASKNGTFVDGQLIEGRASLKDQSVIRAGGSVLVFHTDARELFAAYPLENHGFAGRFHSGPILENLAKAAISTRHVLISGPSGTGKELAAEALSHMMSPDAVPLSLLTYNAARVASQEEITSSLFGVAPRFFSSVDGRPGLIERAAGGVLFIDEVHNLPESVQRVLLRVIEEGYTTRVGEATQRPTDVRFVLSSNLSGATKGLAHDLYARLRLVEIPPLADRVADIPDIFDAVLEKTLARKAMSENPLAPFLTADYHEALCLKGHPMKNVRGLVDICDRLVTDILTGVEPKSALDKLFRDEFEDAFGSRRKEKPASPGPASRYEANKSLIIDTFTECDENLTATEKALKKKGFKCTRRWLSEFLDKWNVRMKTKIN